MDVVKVDHIFSFAFIEMKVFNIEKDGFAIADPFLFQLLMMIGNGLLRPSACLFSSSRTYDHAIVSCPFTASDASRRRPYVAVPKW